MLRSGSIRVTAAQMPPPALAVRVVRGARVAGLVEQGGFPGGQCQAGCGEVAAEPPERAGAENHRVYGRPGQHPCDGDLLLMAPVPPQQGGAAVALGCRACLLEPCAEADEPFKAPQATGEAAAR
jgi:hypothetical protein